MYIDEILKKVKRVHFIGIGGSGMCPLAEILYSFGYELSGSDNNETDTLERIKTLGISVKMGQKAENIEDAEMIIYTKALLPDNPELLAAKNSGIPIFSRDELLGAISRMYNNCIAVCGTHGKTTTSSMLTQTLMYANLDPSAAIGGELPLIKAHGRVGKTENFVAEACEFKDSFLSITPNMTIVLNVDNDHMDYFKTMENLINSFSKFAESTTSTVFYNGDDNNTIKVVSEIDKKLVSFGLNEKNDYIAKDLKEYRGGFFKFSAYKDTQFLFNVKLGVPGKHNVYNALSVIAVCDLLKADYELVKNGIESFGGAHRRFEFLGTYGGITVADDYAHHPTELEVTINSALKMGYNNVWAVFQPFTYSRTYNLLDDFAKVLSKADKVVMTEIMGSREVNTYDIYTKDLAAKIPNSVWFETKREAAEYVGTKAQPGDLIITLGCGDINKADKIIIDTLENRK